MSLSFLTPWAALVALGGVPLLLVWRRSRERAAAVGAALGFPAASTRRSRTDAGLLVAGAALVALTAAQPVVSGTAERQGREATEVIVIFDITRSMHARRSPSEPSRLERSRSFAKELRSAVPDVRFGVTSLTDRILPHLFPTLSANAFAATVDRAITIERPPPDRRSRRATALSALGGLGRAAFFHEDTLHRVAVVLTDGETIPPDFGALRARLEEGRVTTVFVHVWRHDEAIFDESVVGGGSYRPDPSAPRALARVAGAIDARVFTEFEVRELSSSIEQLTRQERLVGQAQELEPRELAGLTAVVATLPFLALLWRRNR